ncbi:MULTISPECIES: DUF4404 family protein [Streptomyces]|uniref:DUF4404 family protein n=1 Tax=Streptomyces TaxID=1883 RepID=UPI0024A413AA|nr:DUF4404 family protein [Streptomyces sp. NBRC 13847]GLW14378.1 chromosome segregation ATPase [Streptomyces sp. NBRC 13847]
MSAHELRAQLKTLREQLAQTPPSSSEDHAELQRLIQQIEAELDATTQTTTLSHSVNLAVERFEIDHPSLAVTLRNIGLALANMGI